jgi:hypothetical protein
MHHAARRRPCLLMLFRLVTLAFALLVSLPAFLKAEDAKPERVLFVGNSITRHGPSAKIGWPGDWGMAASAEGKDYVHLVMDALEKKHRHRPEFRVVNVADFERGFEGYDLAAKLKDEAAFRADTLIVAIGENVPPLKTEEAKAKFKAATVRLLKFLRGDRPCALYVRSCFWAEPVRDAILKEACTAAGGVFIDIGTLGKDEANYARSERKIGHEGVARHPGDRGMQAIAGAIVAAMEKAGK